MSSYSRGSSRQEKGRGNRPHGFWKHGRRKKIRFSVHFNLDSEEFHQLDTIGPLYLGPHNPHFHPSSSHVPHQDPLQPHPNIHVFPPQNASDE